MITKVCEIEYILRGVVNKDCLAVHPLIESNQTVRELFNLDFIPAKNMLLYLYVWHIDLDQVETGYISTCYDKWFLIKTIPINDLERLDFLYSKDHVEEIKKDNSIGVIYIKENKQ